MGYVSNVGIALYERDYERMKSAAIKTNNENIIKFVNSFTEHTGNEPDVIQLEMSWTKWYEHDFVEVGFVKNFLEDVPHRFLRIGEELEDMEENSQGNVETYDMYIERRIIFGDGKKSEGL